MSIKDLPNHEKPREKLIEKGAAGLKDKELLAILLRTGHKGRNVLEMAEQILQKYSRKNLTSLNYKDLINIHGLDSGKACTILAAFELSKRAFDKEDNSLPVIKTAKDAVDQIQNISSGVISSGVRYIKSTFLRYGRIIALVVIITLFSHHPKYYLNILSH